MVEQHRSISILGPLILLWCHAVVSGGFIDMDTPLEARTTVSLVDGSVYDLVMSDEFNIPNRTFTDGHDPVWTALDKSDDDSSQAGGGSLHFYNSSFVTTTADGKLKIQAIADRTEWNRYDHIKKQWKHETAYFKSGMVQSWEKFCFTGGIVEVDIIFPGDPFIGGLWPAVWMLGNLGRATYEASTNNIWPWSFNTCDRTLQPAQAISACNEQNHYGMHPFQGRGATEIDLIEVMTGDSNGPLPGTDPPISIPYADFTLQVAPGVPNNRPQSGAAPQRQNKIVNGHTVSTAQTWYDDLITRGNTSVNPFFYGTYLAETKPGEPVSRSKKQAFQADAVGSIHQLTPAHFNTTHTFRVEWQPGPGGRLDWFTKSYKMDGPNGTFSMEGDGMGQEWVHAFSLRDESLRNLMGSQIPNEPTYLIMNLAISSTWGFPYDTPDWCTKCYDCDDPKCACAFHPGFCRQLKSGEVAMYVDSIRVYQSNNPAAHAGNNHTLGCDPPDYPTKEWIQGHAYRYMRNPPFSYLDIGPLRRVQRGGGSCSTDEDCGSNIVKDNLTEAFLQLKSMIPHALNTVTTQVEPVGRGGCVPRQDFGAMFSSETAGLVCKCNPGYTGPHCLAQEFVDESPSAAELRKSKSPFSSISRILLTPFMMVTILCMLSILLVFLGMQVLSRRRTRKMATEMTTPLLTRPQFKATGNAHLIITGRSV